MSCDGVWVARRVRHGLRRAPDLCPVPLSQWRLAPRGAPVRRCGIDDAGWRAPPRVVLPGATSPRRTHIPTHGKPLRPRFRLLPWLKHREMSTGTGTAKCTGCQAVRAISACVRRRWCHLPPKQRRSRRDTGRRRIVGEGGSWKWAKGSTIVVRHAARRKTGVRAPPWVP